MYIGLDVSVQETSVCALGRDGEIVAETKMVTDPQVLAHGVSRRPGSPGSSGAVSREAGPMSPWLCKGLRDRGYTVVLMETRRIKAALKAVPVKTDRRDARGIAHRLRIGCAGGGFNRCLASRTDPRRFGSGGVRGVRLCNRSRGWSGRCGVCCGPSDCAWAGSRRGTTTPVCGR